MTTFLSYLKEQTDTNDEMQKERHPVSLDGVSGAVSIIELENMEKELKRLQSLMYNAKDNGNLPQYAKYRKDYDALSSKISGIRVTQKKIAEPRKDQFNNMLSRVITTPGQSGDSEYKGQ